MKRSTKVLIIVSAILLALGTLVFCAYRIAFEKYGFLFSLDDDEYYTLQLEMYEMGGHNIAYDPIIPHTMRYDSLKLYDSLKTAKYTKTDNSGLHYGERVSVFRNNKNGQVDKKYVFQLFHDRESQSVYLRWNNITYEVSEFDKAREAIQESFYLYRPSIDFAAVGSSFFAADFFSLPDPHALTKYTGYKNTESVVLNSDSDIISHAKKEVKDGYDESRVSRELYGDRYMVRFDYRFKEENLYKTVYVIMSKDGITELIVNKAGFMARCIE